MVIIFLAGLCGSRIPEHSVFISKGNEVNVTYHQGRSILQKNKAFNLTFTYFWDPHPGTYLLIPNSIHITMDFPFLVTRERMQREKISMPRRPMHFQIASLRWDEKL
jgi:hypothetical protein